MDDATFETEADGYTPPVLTEYGSIEERTKGVFAEGINVSVIL